MKKKLNGVYKGSEPGSVFWLSTEPASLYGDYESLEIGKKYFELYREYLPMFLPIIKIDDERCKELFSDTTFELRDGYFVNEKAGLYFNYMKLMPTFFNDYGKSIISTHAMKSMIGAEKELKLDEFFTKCEMLQKKDIELKNRLNYMCLKRNIKYTE